MGQYSQLPPLTLRGDIPTVGKLLLLGRLTHFDHLNVGRPLPVSPLGSVRIH